MVANGSISAKKIFRKNKKGPGIVVQWILPPLAMLESRHPTSEHARNPSGSASDPAPGWCARKAAGHDTNAWAAASHVGDPDPT